MTQPANKRFVMEDKLTTELALKAPVANPTFTGTISGATIDVSGTIYGNNISASLSGSVSGGNINGTLVSATSNISSTSGNISATAGNVTAGTSVTAASTTAITNTSTAHAVQAGPTSGLNVRIGQDGTNAAVQGVNNGTYSALDVNALGGNVNIGSSATTTAVLGTFTPPRGYMLVSRTVYISSPAAFTKATYPWLRAIRVICVGGGGGGGGAALTAASQNAIGGSGCGGYVAETLITDIAGLASSVTLTVGSGGSAGAAGGAGGAGGDTSFGALCVAKGGVAGSAGAAGPLGVAAGNNSTVAGSVGDIIYPGTASGIKHYLYAASVFRPLPGGNMFFPAPVTAQTVTATGSAGASPGAGIYGVGGFGGINAQSQAAAVAGGIGAGGMMIVELYA